MTIVKCYSELIQLQTFEDRYNYLKLDGVVGRETFGSDRYLNQMLYKTGQWKTCRNEIIIRDDGCDLGVEDYTIYGVILIHHIDPITAQDILNNDPKIFDHENLISSSFNTHNAIHYGNIDLIIKKPIERSKNDTCPWL